MIIDDQGTLRDDDGRIPPCPKCGKRIEHEFTTGPFGPHWAKLKCRTCGAVWFPPKPDRNKAKRPSCQAKLVYRHSRGSCDLCQIPEPLIPAGETLTAHHVAEYQEYGDESRENIWILCSRCHAFVHHQRTYIGHLVKEIQDAKSNNQKHPALDATAPELDPLENVPPRERPTDQGPDSADGPDGEFDGPRDLDDPR
jgi:5-methylcytosine-specific restriction endonuclease McrA